MAKPYPYTIGNGVGGAFFIGAILLDLFKLLLFFLQGGLLILPLLGEILGPVVDVLGSEVVGFIEDIFILGGLGLFGAFKGKNFGPNVLAVLGDMAINAVPEIDDTPSTTATVFFIIMRTRIQDRLNHEAQIAAAKHAQQQQAGYQARLQTAQAAAARAQGQRTQALEASRQAANQVTPTAANDNSAAANDNASEESFGEAA